MGIRDIFRKFKNEDTVIDLRDMPKRRIFNKSTGGTVDLTSGSSRITQSGESNPFAFLGNLAGTSESSSSSGSSSPEPGETSEVSATYISHNQKQKLRGILRDLKAKLDSVYDRIYKITDRIDLLEKKIERLERRAGVSDIWDKMKKQLQLRQLPLISINRNLLIRKQKIAIKDLLIRK